MENVKKKLDKMFVVDCESEGRKMSGGSTLFWRQDIHIQLTSMSNNHIDVVVGKKESGVWRLTGVYRFPEEENKNKTGALLHAHARASEMPWLCGGDLNLMLMDSEKKGRDGFKVHEA